MSDSAPPPAGWYADPEDPARERWWNGSGWSDQHRPSTVDARPDPYAQPAAASPYAPSPYAPAPYGAPAYGSGTNGLALAGLIVSAAGWLVVPLLGAVAGIILSAFGLRQARQREAAGNPNSGRGIAMAGLIIGIVVGGISLLLTALYIGLFVSLMTTPQYY